ncbi:O-antigen ligase family protein [Salinarimonas sp.]|uniref:O-antigen ligase family protein n=1 Tax=Salinarimonas sp. TaxID=2766526 RepID=UPI0032D8DA6E
MSPEATARTALALALATPVLMIASRGIAPVVLAIAAGLLALSSWRAGRSASVLRTLRAGVESAPGALAIGLVVLAGASLTWTPAPTRGAEYVAHVAGSLALLGVALANARVLAPKLSAVGLAAAMTLAGLVLALDVAFDGRLRGALGFSTDLFRLNRAAVALALLLPLATMLLRQRRRPVALGLVWLAGLAAIFSSQSASAQLGVLVVAVTLAVALAAPVATHRLVAVVAVAATLAIPFLAPVINDLIPRAVHDAVGYGTLTIRGEIWREYAALVWERPFLGFGIEAGHVAAALPEAARLADAERALLNWGHPHNGALQVWFELGLVGALLGAALLAALFRALERHAGPLLPAATATAAGAYAVAFVSHGAWQAWWWCLLGLIAMLFAAALSRPASGSPAAPR